MVAVENQGRLSKSRKAAKAAPPQRRPQLAAVAHLVHRQREPPLQRLLDELGALLQRAMEQVRGLNQAFGPNADEVQISLLLLK